MAQVIQAIKNVAASVGNISAQLRESRQEAGEQLKDINNQLSGLKRKAWAAFGGGGGGDAGGDGKAFALSVTVLRMLYSTLHVRRLLLTYIVLELFLKVPK